MFVVGRYHAFKINTHVYIYIYKLKHMPICYIYIYMNVWYEITYIYIYTISNDIIYVYELVWATKTHHNNNEDHEESSNPIELLRGPLLYPWWRTGSSIRSPGFFVGPHRCVLRVSRWYQPLGKVWTFAQLEGCFAVFWILLYNSRI